MGHRTGDFDLRGFSQSERFVSFKRDIDTLKDK